MAAAAAAGWTSGSAAPAGTTEPAKSPGSNEGNGSNGGNGHSESNGAHESTVVTGSAGDSGSVGVAGSPGVKESRPGQAARGTAGGGTYLGLPRRVRQANLAPQLRGLLAAPGAGATHQADGPAGRSPEQTGSLMSAMQAGWLRGRLDDLDPLHAGLDILRGRPSGASGGEAGSDDREDES